MQPTEMVNEIAALVEAVPGIGKVFRFYDHVDSEAEVKAKYMSGGILHAWVVTHVKTPVEDVGNHTRRRDLILIAGRRSVEKGPDSERLHQEMTERVRALFDAQGSRHLANQAGWVRTPLSVEEFSSDIWMNMLCWYALLSCEVEPERIGS